MKNTYSTKLYSQPYLLVLGLCLLIISPNILSEGMFLDGITYSAIAHNLYSHIGSFWEPSYTQTLLPHFFGNPVLAMKLQSYLYVLVGDSVHIDKLYSILTFVITAFFILRISKLVQLKNLWLPLFLWILIPSVTWSMTNNLLENTLSIGTTSAVYFYLKSVYNNHKRRYLWIVISGLLLAIGFFVKGLVAFYPLGLPFFYYIIVQNKNYIKIIIDTLLLFLATVVPLLLLVLIIPAAKIFLIHYLQEQVIYSLQNVVNVQSRFQIVSDLLSNLIPVFILFFIIWIYAKRKKIHVSFFSRYQHGLMFICLGLAGVLPIMCSMKQSGIYIFTTYPIFAIGGSFFLDNFFDFNARVSTILKKIGIVFIILALVSMFIFKNILVRDKSQLYDMKIILPQLQANTTINISPQLGQDWYLHAYYYRYKNISLESIQTHKQEYLLIDKENFNDSLLFHYTIINLPTKFYDLYKLKPPL